MSTRFGRTIAATAILLLPGTAIAAAQEPIPTPPCESPFNPVLGPGGKHEDVPTPQLPLWGDSVTYGYTLDVSGSQQVPQALSADVSIALTWDDPVSDFDLTVIDWEGTEHGSWSVNPIDGPGESVFLFAMPHCADVSVEVLNWAGLPVANVDLDLTVSNLRP